MTKKTKVEKTRVTVYVPAHLNEIAKKSGIVKSKFYARALEHFINTSGGMKKMMKEIKKNDT